MRTVLLAGAALFAATASAEQAQAQLWSNPALSAGPMPSNQPALSGELRRDDRPDRPDRPGRTTVVLGYYGGEWARYNNRSFEPDSYNDWWHDRPERSYPRWMQNNDKCERRWWGGGSWRC